MQDAIKICLITKILRIYLALLKSNYPVKYNILFHNSAPFNLKTQIIPILSCQLAKQYPIYPTLNNFTLLQYHNFLTTVIQICQRNVHQPGSPVLLYYALEYTAKSVQETLDKKKKQQIVHSTTEEKKNDFSSNNALRNIFVVVGESLDKKLPVILNYTKFSFKIKNTTQAIIQQCGSSNNSSIIKLLFLNEIYILHIFAKKTKQQFRNILTLYLNWKYTHKECETICGDSSAPHFIEEHIFPCYQKSIFEPIIFSRVGVSSNPFRSSAAKVCFEAPTSNYQNESVLSKNNNLEDVCSNLFFSEPLPVGTGYNSKIHVYF